MAWHSFDCPSCDTENWYDNGDESDLTGFDVDRVNCRKCGNTVLLFDENGDTLRVIKRTDWADEGKSGPE